MKEVNRRLFMKQLGLLGAGYGLASLMSSCEDRLDPLTIPEKSFKIHELKIRARYGTNFTKLIKTRDFYTQLLGLPEIVNSVNYVYTIQIGESLLTFQPSNLDPTKEDTYFPQYHFTIAIPSNQIENCLDWLMNKDGKYPDGPSEPIPLWNDYQTGAEIVRRNLYNSQSIFIKDPAGNVVEILARHDMNNTQEGDFNKSMFLGITEVGIVTREIRKSAKLLKDTFGVEEVAGSSNSFKPVGGPTGLLKLIVPGKPWIPTDNELAVAHEMELTVRHTELLDPILIPESGTLLKTIV